MASIIKRKSKYSVVYRYIDDNGVEKQKWETFSTNAEAKKRKSEIEYQISTNTFVTPNCKTVQELLYDYVTIYGVNKWALSTYNTNKSLIDNYINPFIGDLKLEECTPKAMEQYYLNMLKVKAVARAYQKEKDIMVTPSTIRELHKILRSAFNQAVKWELMLRNPVEKATLPSVEKNIRDIWTSDILFEALEKCDDERLKLCINLAFSCSLRMGELLALTWDCINISDESIADGSAYLFVDKELQRVDRSAMNELDGKDVKLQFPCFKPAGSTVLVLKTPKTQSSVRRVYIPKTVAEMLLILKKEQEELKDLLGNEYKNYNLVICSSDGRPIEGQIVNRAFGKLIREHNLPKVVFHSLRHTSVTYKLKLNGGDIKAVQGDTGHSQINMVTDVYSHIVDEDRCKNAQKLQNAFYGQSDKTPTTETILDDRSKQLLELINQSPELAEILLKTLSAKNNS
ncbi:tyrosine-type recombinase/integrase [Chakrabartyella piscis]|uniref:tyrosine-type recombinase/integrase n=1 Tax=Chakrabartyella piscis TaxID=2918914 RepID=UPI002958BEA9|nr:tyrosine-type recombinase/integrase [Chakrabartyella piscis]